jgi:hypothetical protein
MAGYVKLFSSILDSTVWDTPPAVTKVWITLMAMADRDGVVSSSLPGLAKRARVDIATTEKALGLFMSPDKYSKTPDYEGRRLAVVEGGWVLLNYAKHRELMSREDAREKNAERQRRWRENHPVTPRNGEPLHVTLGDANNDIASAASDPSASPSADLDPSVEVDPISSGGEAAPPPTPPAVTPIDKVLLTYPCVGPVRAWDLTASKVKHWRSLFPDLDLGKECRAALAHVEATPSKRKTANGMDRFLVAWFTRTQNRGVGRGASSAQVSRGEKTQENVGDWLNRKAKK